MCQTSEKRLAIERHWLQPTTTTATTSNALSNRFSLFSLFSYFFCSLSLSLSLCHFILHFLVILLRTFCDFYKRYIARTLLSFFWVSKCWRVFLLLLLFCLQFNSQIVIQLWALALETHTHAYKTHTVCVCVLYIL